MDGAGNVVIAGTFQGTENFGTGPLVSAGSWDIYVAKYSVSGAPVWSRRFGGAGDEIAYRRLRRCRRQRRGFGILPIRDRFRRRTGLARSATRTCSSSIWRRSRQVRPRPHRSAVSSLLTVAVAGATQGNRLRSARSDSPQEHLDIRTGMDVHAAGQTAGGADA
jgi:hypothetical protein